MKAAGIISSGNDRSRKRRADDIEVLGIESDDEVSLSVSSHNTMLTTIVKSLNEHSSHQNMQRTETPSKKVKPELTAQDELSTQPRTRDEEEDDNKREAEAIGRGAIDQIKEGGGVEEEFDMLAEDEDDNNMRQSSVNAGGFDGLIPPISSSLGIEIFKEEEDV